MPSLRFTKEYYTVSEIASLLSVCRQKAHYIVLSEMEYVDLGTPRRHLLRVPTDAYARWQQKSVHGNKNLSNASING